MQLANIVHYEIAFCDKFAGFVKVSAFDNKL